MTGPIWGSVWCSLPFWMTTVSFKPNLCLNFSRRSPSFFVYFFTLTFGKSVKKFTKGQNQYYFMLCYLSYTEIRDVENQCYVICFIREYGSRKPTLFYLSYTGIRVVENQHCVTISYTEIRGVEKKVNATLSGPRGNTGCGKSTLRFYVIHGNTGC